MIFAHIAIGTSALLIGSWIGVLSASLLAPLNNSFTAIIWCLPMMCAALALAAAPLTRNMVRRFKFFNAVALFLFLATLLFRTVNLGWGEFQGDEARALLLAEQIITGQPEKIFTHRKGPGEILTAASTLLTVGPDSEALLRFPFAVAGVALLCAIAGIVSAISSPWLGLLAFFLAAQDGVLLGFSRIIQYQMPMLLFSATGWLLIVTGVWRSYPIWVGIFFGASLLCHYDAIFLVGPALLLIIFQAYKNIALRRPAIFMCLACALLTVSFYLPFFCSENFAQTQAYLTARATSTRLPTLNFWRWFNTWQMYSGSVASIALGLALILAITFSLNSGPLIVGGALACGAALWLLPFSIPVLIQIAVFVAGSLIILKSLRGHQRLAFIVLLMPFFIFGFWFARPNTHFLITAPPLIIFICYIANELRPRPKLLFASIIIFGLAFSLNHQRTLFLRQALERPKLRADVVEFGMNHRTGLKAASEFLADKGLNLAVYTNDDYLVANWYLRKHAALNVAEILAPDLFIEIQKPREPSARLAARDNYTLIGRVFVSDNSSNKKRAADIFFKKSLLDLKTIPAGQPAERIYEDEN